VQIQGLPFTAASPAGGYAGYAIVDWRNLATTWVNLMMTVAGGTTFASVFGATAAATGNVVNQLTATDTGNTTAFGASFVYRAGA
jgi:hypothetical protein